MKGKGSRPRKEGVRITGKEGYGLQGEIPRKAERDRARQRETERERHSNTNYGMLCHVMSCYGIQLQS